MEKKVTFRREGHDRLVDFIKGLAIIGVIYVSTLLILVIKNVHVVLEKYKIARLIECYGRDSYSIFIIQLVVFWIFRTLHYDRYDISLYTFVFTLLTTTLPLMWSTYKYCIKQNQEKM